MSLSGALRTPSVQYFNGIYVAVFVVSIIDGQKNAGVQGRIALPPQQSVEDLILDHNVENFETSIYNLHGPPCSLDIQRDLHRPKNSHQPLYLIPGTKLFWLPNIEGRLLVPRTSTIELYCSSGFLNKGQPNNSDSSVHLNKHSVSLHVTCVDDSRFAVHGQIYEFHQLACQEPVRYTVERTTDQCGHCERDENVNPGDRGFDVGLIYRVGYNITSTRFVETMRVCHDMARLRTFYTQHILLPANGHFEKSVKRLNFSTTGFFQGHNMHALYTQKHQLKLLGALLGTSPNEFTTVNITANSFLARGHLAAKSDMIYATQQRSTFTYLNAAPQWQSFNGGKWATMEDRVRKFISTHALEVICYTGTWGTMELANRNGEIKQLHLTTDRNGNGVLAVPKLFYRVLVNRQRPQTGIALVGVNNPQANMSLIREQYIICSDIQEEVSWLGWMSNRDTGLKKGYMYACHVDEFARRIRHLPKQLLQVNELLT